MDPAWIGVIGTGIGAAIGVTPNAVTAVLNWRTANADRDRAAAEKVRDENRAQIREWRDGVAAAAAEYQQWIIGRYGTDRTESRVATVGVEPTDTPNATATPWFASLRRHISEGGPAAEYRNAETLECDADVVRDLHREIDRIERERLDD